MTTNLPSHARTGQTNYFGRRKKEIYIRIHVPILTNRNSKLANYPMMKYCSLMNIDVRIKSIQLVDRPSMHPGKNSKQTSMDMILKEWKVYDYMLSHHMGITLINQGRRKSLLQSSSSSCCMKLCGLCNKVLLLLLPRRRP